MNMDFYGYFEFGDTEALPAFAMAHRFAHEAESAALAAQFGQTIGTYNVSGENVLATWAGLMDGSVPEMTREMFDWLEVHNENHQDMLSALQGVTQGIVTQEVDLSLTDFRDPTQLYDWLTLHQQLHQIEQDALGLS